MVYVLKNRKCTNFPDDSGKQSFGLFRIIPDHHELVAELREACFDTLSTFGERNVWRLPILLVQTIRNLELNMRSFKQVKLYVGTEVSFVSDECAVTILPFQIFQIVNVMYISFREVV